MTGKGRKGRDGREGRRRSSQTSAAPKTVLGVNAVWVVGLSVVVVILLAAAVLVLARPKTPAPTTLSEATVAVSEREGPALGPITATVKIVEYGDFGCPTCRAWHQTGALNHLRAKYGDKIQFIWRDFPVITAQSPKAAEAGQCAYDQGKFWEYHDYLYAHPDALSVEGLKASAGAVGLQANTFSQCLDSGKYQAQIDRSIQDGTARQIVGTPTFFINGRQVSGVPSFDYLVSIIDPLLAGN